MIAGQLLRDEIESGSEHGQLIDRLLKEGNIVPSYITVQLLQQEMIKYSGFRVIIDGFPRNLENYNAWKSSVDSLRLSRSAKQAGKQLRYNDCLLFLNCSEEAMLSRLNVRRQSSGRSDDNLDTIMKRFQVFRRDTMPVLTAYQQRPSDDFPGFFVNVNAEGSKKDVLENSKQMMTPVFHNEVLSTCGDWMRYFGTGNINLIPRLQPHFSISINSRVNCIAIFLIRC
jgi:UMP-CMP kinase